MTACQAPQHTFCTNLCAQRGRSRRADQNRSRAGLHRRRRPASWCAPASWLRSRLTFGKYMGKLILHSPYGSCDKTARSQAKTAWTLVTIFMLRHPETHLQILQSLATIINQGICSPTSPPTSRASTGFATSLPSCAEYLLSSLTSQALLSFISR